VTNVLLGAGASAALHKACDLASKLAQDGHAVRSVLTPRAAELVSPQLFEALTGEAAMVSEFGHERRSAMDHIELAKWADLFVVAPAPADLVSRLALGLAGDLLTTVALALPREVPRLLAPAMNPAMWSAFPIARHAETLRGDGWRILEPDDGHMACGDAGTGRMPEPEAIRAAIAEVLADSGS
jgi:phosphopantothenoylcysteine decarboxylase/phosphopantothenate--cysteine ligase